MSFMPIPDRTPTPRELAYLDALERGERRPSISGWAGQMCRKFGWSETVYRAPDGTEAARSTLPDALDAIALVRAGYRAVGFALTVRGRRILARSRGTAAEPAAP